MRIQAGEAIFGIPMLIWRDAFRVLDRGSCPCSGPWLEKRLGLDQDKGRACLAELAKAGMITQDDLGNWRLSVKGHALALSSLRTFSRKSVERALQAFLERVDTVNREDCFFVKVRRVRVFGSYLSDVQVLGDLDLAIDLASKFDKLTFARLARLSPHPPRHLKDLDVIYWPFIHVRRFLKGRSPIVSLHVEDPLVDRVASRVIFEEPTARDPRSLPSHVLGDR